MSKQNKLSPKASSKSVEQKAAPKQVEQKAPPVEQKAAPKAAPPVREPKHAPTAKIEWLTASNPKRPGTASHARAELYWGKKTVADYLAAGGQRVDLSWDAAHNFIRIG